MSGRVIRRVKQIATQENFDGWLIFVNRVGNMIHDRPDGLPVPDAIAGVNGGNGDA